MTNTSNSPHEEEGLSPRCRKALIYFSFLGLLSTTGLGWYELVHKPFTETQTVANTTKEKTEKIISPPITIQPRKRKTPFTESCTKWELVKSPKGNYEICAGNNP